MNNILGIFYDEIINEAAQGTVDCFFIFNIQFSTIIENKRIITVSDYDNTLIPTLIIKDKDKFNALLIQYIELAYDFYKDNFYYKFEDSNNFDKNYIKALLTLLWSNATSEDFINPCQYIQRRIDFLLDTTLLKEDSVINTSLGKIRTKVIKDTPYNETPYYLSFCIDGNEMPVVRVGISNQKAYIYAIQNTSDLVIRDKSLNRKLYKVNEGIDLKGESVDNINDPENLSGVTPATLISATLAIYFLKELGISDIEIPVMLVVRWNAKEIAYQKYARKIVDINNRQKYIDEELEKHFNIQRNLSDKFIRTFRRLAYHFDDIDITAIPFVHDVNMSLKIGDKVKCNNPLLQELAEIYRTRDLKENEETIDEYDFSCLDLEYDEEKKFGI